MFFALLILGLFCSQILCEKRIQVATKSGVVNGLDLDGYYAFRGIPFAAPPVGDLRFQPPKPVEPWSTPLDASKWGPGCPQLCHLPPRTCPKQTSEDCLTLNIYVPKSGPLSSQSSPLPVLVFLPGGHFEQGSAGTELYDGARLSQTGNFILITTNYRLGVLGWLAFEKLGLHGNLGFKDQQMALKWVNENVQFFGGDAQRITLAGQSAGAVSVAAHMISEESEPLFQQAIIMSNPFVIPMRSLQSASMVGERFSELVGCTTFDCLKDLPTDKILVAQKEVESHVNITIPLVTFMELTVTYDGVDIKENALDAFMNGHAQKKPLMLGTVHNEAVIFIHEASQKPLNSLEYTAILTAVFYHRAAIASVLYRYPPSIIGDQRPLLSLLGTEYIFNCVSRYVGTNFVNKTGAPTYIYEFNMTLPAEVWGSRYAYCSEDGISCHGAELPYFFGSLLDAGVHVTDDEKRLIQGMMQYWGNFVHSGNPNQGVATPQTEWPQFTESHHLNMELMTPQPHVVENNRGTICDFWDSLGHPPYHYGGDPPSIAALKEVLERIKERQSL